MNSCLARARIINGLRAARATLPLLYEVPTLMLTLVVARPDEGCKDVV
jgi:hypothetical protein